MHLVLARWSQPSPDTRCGHLVHACWFVPTPQLGAAPARVLDLGQRRPADRPVSSPTDGLTRVSGCYSPPGCGCRWWSQAATVLRVDVEGMRGCEGSRRWDAARRLGVGRRSHPQQDHAEAFAGRRNQPAPRCMCNIAVMLLGPVRRMRRSPRCARNCCSTALSSSSSPTTSQGCCMATWEHRSRRALQFLRS